ncbi:hypothetical protein C8F01DRAFT_270473 [Mycena amicta]|nr:hypothetical protein C8F01DRAFT_270473 [Mycena amicta]
MDVYRLISLLAGALVVEFISHLTPIPHFSAPIPGVQSTDWPPLLCSSPSVLCIHARKNYFRHAVEAAVPRSAVGSCSTLQIRLAFSVAQRRHTSTNPKDDTGPKLTRTRPCLFPCNNGGEATTTSIA